MKTIIRAEYEARLKSEYVEAEKILTELSEQIKETTDNLKQQGRIMTAGAFLYKTECFLYVEHIVETDICVDVLSEKGKHAEGFQDEVNGWLSDIADFFENKTEIQAVWKHMTPVFYTDEPENHDLSFWSRKTAPLKGCGRIATLYPDKADSYVEHHIALVKEGKLEGDRYQFISKSGYRLFSYFEFPRDNERVNRRHTNEKSDEIDIWLSLDPKSHFDHYQEADGADFLIIRTLCWTEP